MDILQINVLVLAYLGDTIYENYIRKHLINSGIANVNDLQKEAKKNKDFELADSIRNDLLSKGIELLDTREGTTYRIIGE